MNNTAPVYLCDLISVNDKSILQVQVDPLILVYYMFPQLVRMCANSFFERSFMYVTPSLWNTLDFGIRHLFIDSQCQLQ